MKSFLVIIILACPFILRSQDKTIQVEAISGGEGVFVVLEVPKASNAISFEIERRKSSLRKWEKVAEMQPPKTYEEFRKRFELAVQSIPAGILPKIESPRIVWNDLQEDGEWSDRWMPYLPVKLALGHAYLDQNLQKGIFYIYRVTINQESHSMLTLLTNEVSYPAPLPYARPLFLNHDISGSSAEIQYLLQDAKRPHSISLFRATGDNDNFTRMDDALYDFRSLTDSLICTIRDNTVSKHQSYQYFVQLNDRYGNHSNSSDTIVVLTAAINHHAPPSNMVVKQVDDYLQLTWSSKDPANIIGIEISKSENDKDYISIGTVAGTDSIYTDLNVLPMEIYYYRLRLIGPMGETSPWSTSYYGYILSMKKPLAPQNIQGKGIEQGVQIKWPSDPSLDGYLVYRSNTYTSDLEQVSSLLTTQVDSMIFVDSAVHLTGKYVYGYCLKAVSKSHIESDYSDTVYVRPTTAVVLIPPTGLVGHPQGSAIHLYWHNMADLVDRSVYGYQLVRREEISQPFMPLNQGMILTEVNHYLDSMVIPGTTYEYGLYAIDALGNTSNLSNTIKVTTHVSRPAPPTGVRYFSNESEQKLQWDPPLQGNLESYKVYKYKRGSDPALVGTVKSSQTEYPLDISPPGELLFYFVTSVLKNGVESKPSDELPVRQNL